jgi:hypothetical protein
MSASRQFAQQSLSFGLTPDLRQSQTFVLTTKPLVGHLVLLVGKYQMADCYFHTWVRPN